MSQVRPALSRQTIVDVAVRRLDDGAPFTSLTIRALAEELGVTPMALYRHIADKDDLLLDVIDVLLARGGLPAPDSDWRDAIGHLVNTLRDVFKLHPTMVEIFCRRPVTTPTALVRLDAGVTALERGGFSPAEALEAWAAIHTFVVGFSAIEAGRAGYIAQHPLPLVTDDRARMIAGFPGEAPFQRGIRALIDGLDASRDPVEHPV